MSVITCFLEKHGTRLGLTSDIPADRLNTLLLTPRFRASNHVIFVVFAPSSSDPLLVIKAPRLHSHRGPLEREAANLQAVQMSRPGGFDTIPRLLAFEEYAGTLLLVQTALTGEPMDPARVRRDAAGCCQAILHWLLQLQEPSAQPTLIDPGWFERLVQQPLRFFADNLDLTDNEMRLIEQTRRLATTLRKAHIPLVFEHGDLSHPNILLQNQGNIAVLDWEQAEVHGLPATDLIFFLTYVAIARLRRRTQQACRQAYHQAFFGPDPWARPYLEQYCAHLGLPAPVLPALMALCWPRHLARLLSRLAPDAKPTGALPEDAAEWLRRHRFYTLWQHTLQHSEV